MRFKYTTAVLIFSSICFSTTARAAGWATDDYSITGLGRAYSDGSLVGDDFSALAYNPAAMTLGNSGMQVGASYVHEHANVKGEFKGHINSTMEAYVAIPSFFTQYKLNDTFTVGAGFYVPFGLASKYRPIWGATDHGIDAEVKIADYSLGMGMKLTDKLSLGYAIIARHETVEITSTSQDIYLNKMNAEDWALGQHFGLMYQLSDATRFGIAYRTRTQHQGKGKSSVDIYCKGLGPLSDPAFCSFETKLSMNAPEHVLINAYHQLNDKLGLSFGAKWTRWNRFDALTFTSNQIDPLTRKPFKTETAQNWKNTWKFAVGADYKYDENWTFRTGFGFDKSPVPNSYERIASLPDADRYNTALGFTYKAGKWSYDLGYMFMYFKNYHVRNDRHDKSGKATSNMLDAKYDMYVHVLGAQVKYEF